MVEPNENALGVPPNPVIWLEVLEFPNNELCCMLDCRPKVKHSEPELACLVIAPKENALVVPPNPVVWLGVFQLLITNRFY